MWSNTSSSDAIRAPSIGFPECHSAPSSRHPWENRTALRHGGDRRRAGSAYSRSVYQMEPISTAHGPSDRTKPVDEAHSGRFRSQPVRPAQEGGMASIYTGYPSRIIAGIAVPRVVAAELNP